MTFSFIPPRLLKRIFKTEEVLSINFFISSILVLLSIFLLKWLPQFNHSIKSNICFCLSNKLLGIPCIGCGITRGILKLLDGDIIGSFLMNPGSALIIISLFVQLPLQILTLIKRVSKKVMLKFNQNLSYFIITCLVIVWALRIIFPDQIFSTL